MFHKIEDMEETRNKSSTKKNFYIHDFYYKDELDKIDKCLKMYALMVNETLGELHLRPRLVEVLGFYLLKGYNSEAKDLIVNTIGIERQNLNQINSELTRKGYLIIDPYNYRTKKLNAGLTQLKEYIEDNDDFCAMMFKMVKTKPKPKEDGNIVHE